MEVDAVILTEKTKSLCWMVGCTKSVTDTGDYGLHAFLTTVSTGSFQHWRATFSPAVNQVLSFALNVAGKKTLIWVIWLVEDSPSLRFKDIQGLVDGFSLHTILHSMGYTGNKVLSSYRNWLYSELNMSEHALGLRGRDIQKSSNIKSTQILESNSPPKTDFSQV